MRRLLLRGSLRGRLSCWLALQAMLGLGVVCVAAYVVIAMTLASLAAEVVEFHEAALWEVSMCAEVQGDASASVDAPLLRRALSNLLCNATRYGDPGSRVFIRIEPLLEGGVEISVTKRGPDVEPVHLPRLFDRFYRADAARTHGDRNHGLGLAIVAGIARMHGGEVFAESANGITCIGMRLGQAPA